MSLAELGSLGIRPKIRPPGRGSKLCAKLWGRFFSFFFDLIQIIGDFGRPKAGRGFWPAEGRLVKIIGDFVRPKAGDYVVVWAHGEPTSGSTRCESQP